MPKRHKTLLITGCGRCGTKYMSILLKKHGVDAPHEQMGRDGIVSWYLASGADYVPIGPGWRDFSFEHSIQIVRHPLNAIPSITYLSDQAWEFICQHIPCYLNEPLVERAAKYWYYWNELAEQVTNDYIRLEDLSQITSFFSEKLNVHLDKAILQTLSRDINSRRYGKLFHWTEEVLLRLGMTKRLPMLKFIFRRRDENKNMAIDLLYNHDPDLLPMISEKARYYGYHI